MQTNTCSKCLKEISIENIMFCPFCGSELINNNEDKASQEVIQEIAKCEKIENPVKKHKKLMELRSIFPNTLEIERAILFFGRLHERSAKKIDFSVIKCYLLQMYLTPEEFTENQKIEMQDELFNSPQLQHCLSLTNSKEQFFNDYLQELSKRYIELFLLSSSKYMPTFFGFSSKSKAPLNLAIPVGVMYKEILLSTTINEQQKMQLYKALYAGFKQVLGDTTYLDEQIINLNIPSF